ncbi:hypothetical protein LDENG_00084530 [Lucifuga dentata]|nr:hypothetical protein LDENG_00084530 [Lucifuga dentata]
MAVQKKQSVIPPSRGTLSTRNIERKRNGSGRPGENGSHIKPDSQAKKTNSSVNKSAQISNTTSPRATAGPNGQKVDERLKLARERREEHQRLLASREQKRLEREQQAQRYYEQQLQERKKRLLEQRLKEERRRTAVEEKRKQKLKEEKERYESALRRTLEKSQKAQQNLSQNSRGRKLAKTNVPRPLPLTTWEKNLVSRLITPTCSYLARSRSAGCESGKEVVHVCRRAVSFHSTNTTNNTITPPKPQNHSGPVHHRPSPSSPSPKPNNSHHGSTNKTQNKAVRLQHTDKKNSNAGPHVQSPAVKHITNTRTKTASPSPEQSPRRSVSRHSTLLQLELPSVPEEDVVVCSSALSPGNSRPIRTLAEGQREKTGEENLPQTPHLNQPDNETAAKPRSVGDERSFQIPPEPAPQPSEVRPLAGTTDPEEALRLLAEKRREARLQREREEQERLQREEAVRRSREELERKRAEEREQQQAEAQRLIEEKRRREEEEQRRAEEERAEAMREAALLQKQREAEQAREREKAEQMRQEREILVRKEEAERQVRKKRLEEIMRRTRRSDSPDMKAVSARISPNDAQPKENTQLVQIGSIDQGVKLPVGTKTSQLVLSNVEDMVPVVAFKERRSLRTLTGLEEIQTQQRAEVI